MTADLDDFKDLVSRMCWRPIDTAPKNGVFVLLYCAEDRSRWLASWQGLGWHGVDELGLTREGHSFGDPDVVTGWAVNAWMPLPDPPYTETADPGRNSSGGAIVHCTWETRYAQWVDLIVRCVAELPGRTSPEDDPTAMLVSEGELRDILWGNLPPAMPTDQSDAARPAPDEEAPASEQAATSDEIHELREAIRAYISECDNPVPDYSHRRVLRNRLRDLAGCPPEPQR